MHHRLEHRDVDLRGASGAVTPGDRAEDAAGGIEPG
jgi:hypothetical protein